MKYYIIPKEDIAMELHARNADDAICTFCTFAASMNTYFRAVTEEEYEKIKEEIKFEHHKDFVLDFMEDVAVDDFDIPEKDAREVAERAYENYCDECGTEYECIEIACDEYWEDHEVFEEDDE